jgi:formate/nitrite transporter
MNKSIQIDPFSPAEVALLMKTIGIAKANMPTLQMLALGVLAGAFISFGAMYYTTVMTGHGDLYGPPKLLGGLVFSLGFILVVIAGAELFTGNNLIVMAWAEKQISTRLLLRNWGIVYAANMVGAFAMLVMVTLSGFLDGDHHQVGVTAIKIAQAKVDITFVEAFLKGLFCNALVCLASWMCYAARSVTDKILAVLLPVSGFVAMGFEHCVANMYMIPIGIIASLDPQILTAGGLGAEQVANLGIGPFLHNLLPVTLGNIVGGAGMVALVYYFIYLRGKGTGM